MLKRTLCLLLVFCLLPVAAFARVMPPPDDLPEDAWYYQDVTDLLASGIARLRESGIFEPLSDITRAEFVAMLAALSGESLSSYFTASMFTDVAPDAWYLGAVNWAYVTGIVNGKTKTEFAPDAPITREELAATISRYFEHKKVKPERLRLPHAFTDQTSISAWARDAVRAADRAAIVSGYPNGSFAPHKTATRAEACRMICAVRDMQRGPSAGMTDVLVLLYHNFEETEIPAGLSPKYSTTAAKFRADLDALLAMGLKPISLAQYYRGDYDKTVDSFILNFDDGYRSNYEIAWPILKEYNIHADIFMTTDKFYFDNNFSPAMAREMEESGVVSVYSHSIKHEDMSKLDHDTLVNRMQLSQAVISEELPRARDFFFAYPHGLYSEETARILHQEVGVQLQLVLNNLPQSLHGKYGLVSRRNVAYGTDVAALAREYFRMS